MTTTYVELEHLRVPLAPIFWPSCKMCAWSGGATSDRVEADTIAASHDCVATPADAVPRIYVRFGEDEVRSLAFGSREAAEAFLAEQRAHGAPVRTEP